MNPNALVEEVDPEAVPLRKKASESLHSGDWSGWTAAELGQLTTEWKYNGSLIKDIVRNGREFPDNLWEAMNRNQTHSNLSSELMYAIIGQVGTQFNFHPSYFSRLDNYGRMMVTKTAKRIVKVNRNASPEYKAQLKGRGIDIDDAAAARAKEFLDQIKRSKGGVTREQSKLEHSKLDLHPVMTEHWKKYMPDELPEAIGPWEKVRAKLKTQDRQTIDMIMRELEKVGVIKPNESGSKLFDPEAYKTLLARKNIKYPVRVIKDFRGQYHNMQMIRGNKANAALVSVGLPDSVENDWKKNHPKLYGFIKELRKSNHKSVMKSKNPIGWVRIDKLGSEDWLIEELQQDVDNLAQEEVGDVKYGAATHKSRHDKVAKRVEGARMTVARFEELRKLVAAWKEEADKWGPIWQRELEKNQTAFHNGERSGDVEKQDKLLQEARAKALTSDISGYIRPDQWFYPKYVDYFLFDVIDDYIKTNKATLQKQEEDLSIHKTALDYKLPETENAQKWLQDQEAVNTFLKDFPRMALHAVKVAAKAAGVKRLWWVTLSQKIAIGNAKPPKDWTSDRLAKKFGFKKVQLEANPTYSSPSYAIGGTGVVPTILSHRKSMEANAANGQQFKYQNPDDFLWMVPVDQMVTEKLSLIGQTVFG